MSHETKMAIVEDILTGIVCSQAWGREQLNDPEIVKNAAQLERVMCTVSEYLPEEMLAALEDAITNCIGAHEQAAILFGIHTADALREIAAGAVA
ncbi:MAG: hypothetical protein ACLURW_15545 [Flavonifractor plautii]